MLWKQTEGKLLAQVLTEREDVRLLVVRAMCNGAGIGCWSRGHKGGRMGAVYLRNNETSGPKTQLVRQVKRPVVASMMNLQGLKKKKKLKKKTKTIRIGERGYDGNMK